LYSVGTFGCNLDCGFCQNAILARSELEVIPSKYTSPEELVQTAMEKNVDGRGLFSLLNTNGYIEAGAREDLLENIDAVKVDIKGFGERTYRELCQADLGPVLETCIRIKEKGIHLELAYPLIPEWTDDPGMLSKFAQWVRDEIGRDVPIHIFRFQPAYHLSRSRSPEMTELHAAREQLLRAGLRYVYLGGVTGEDQDTRCPECGAVVVSRKAEEASEKIFVKKEQVSRFCPTFSKVEVFTLDGCCPTCGESLPIR
jgi:pyruvate formate lyase activating enzyme